MRKRPSILLTMLLLLTCLSGCGTAKSVKRAHAIQRKVMIQLQRDHAAVEDALLKDFLAEALSHLEDLKQAKLNVRSKEITTVGSDGTETKIRVLDTIELTTILKQVKQQEEVIRKRIADHRERLELVNMNHEIAIRIHDAIGEYFERDKITQEDVDKLTDKVTEIAEGVTE